ncbi:nickel transporter [Streptomyces sp. PSKA28]|uniref:Nickel transporter n=1 Tax=Streptomyces himalayensis subsp. himalayensis TaxID=2756131 RepID=A0A7W0DRM9_9ACTN|nr:nickel transporter [Streptomyces himalayensis]MBA2949994.1 nickel transporter [Streptomyces himalayensis subsp. himalayensis]
MGAGGHRPPTGPHQTTHRSTHPAGAARNSRTRPTGGIVILRNPLAACAALLVAVATLVLLPATAASAHPLGNFTVNRYDGLVAAPGALRVDHVEDLAEIPATQTQPRIKELGIAGWARERCRAAAHGSRVEIGGHAVGLTVGASHARVRPGQAGLPTLRLECRLTAPLPEGRAVTVVFRAAGDAGPGWREITARGDRRTLARSDVPEESVSRRLADYPQRLLSSPPDRTSASLRAVPGGPALSEERAAPPAASVLPRGADRWTQALTGLVARHDLTPAFAALALGTAVVLGAMHALAPGHGKTLMAATAAARSRATLRDVLPLAASVTVTHTLGVVVLGLLIATGSAAAPSVISWLGVASGALVTVAGAGLLRRAWRQRGHSHAHDHSHGHAHAYGHSHLHGHSHSHGHPREHGKPHEHAHPDRPPQADERPGMDPDSHAHATAGAKTHGSTAPVPSPQPPSHEHKETPSNAREHPHRSRRPDTDAKAGAAGAGAETDPGPPTLRGTFFLGFAGGLVPSPSAVVVLVGAAALGQAWFGFLLVLAYGAGLALTLTAAGFAVVRVGGRVVQALVDRPDRGRGRLGGGLGGRGGYRLTGRLSAAARRLVPLGSACLVVAVGCGLVLKGAATALG